MCITHTCHCPRAVLQTHESPFFPPSLHQFSAVDERKLPTFRCRGSTRSLLLFPQAEMTADCASRSGHCGPGDFSGNSFVPHILITAIEKMESPHPTHKSDFLIMTAILQTPWQRIKHRSPAILDAGQYLAHWPLNLNSLTFTFSRSCISNPKINLRLLLFHYHHVFRSDNAPVLQSMPKWYTR